MERRSERIFGQRYRCSEVKILQLNDHLICLLCNGYFIDATTIIECLHSFCRSCIVRYLESNNHCPICNVLIHKAQPLLNIRVDHVLQCLVYKLIPGLLTKEMNDRREFYLRSELNVGTRVNSPMPGTSTTLQEGCSKNLFSLNSTSSVAAAAGDTESVSISLEYSTRSRQENRSEKLKLELNESLDRRYLLCPAAFTVACLKKFIRKKFDLSLVYKIEIFHDDENLVDHYSMMDIAFIFQWPKKAPLQLFYSVSYSSSAKRKLSSSETIETENLMIRKEETKAITTDAAENTTEIATVTSRTSRESCRNLAHAEVQTDLASFEINPKSSRHVSKKLKLSSDDRAFVDDLTKKSDVDLSFSGRKKKSSAKDDEDVVCMTNVSKKSRSLEITDVTLREKMKDFRLSNPENISFTDVVSSGRDDEIYLSVRSGFTNGITSCGITFPNVEPNYENDESVGKNLLENNGYLENSKSFVNHEMAFLSGENVNFNEQSYNNRKDQSSASNAVNNSIVTNNNNASLVTDRTGVLMETSLDMKINSSSSVSRDHNFSMLSGFKGTCLSNDSQDRKIYQNRLTNDDGIMNDVDFRRLLEGRSEEEVKKRSDVVMSKGWYSSSCVGPVDGQVMFGNLNGEEVREKVFLASTSPKEIPYLTVTSAGQSDDVGYFQSSKGEMSSSQNEPLVKNQAMEDDQMMMGDLEQICSSTDKGGGGGVYFTFASQSMVGDPQHVLDLNSALRICKPFLANDETHPTAYMPQLPLATMATNMVPYSSYLQPNYVDEKSDEMTISAIHDNAPLAPMQNLLPASYFEDTESSSTSPLYSFTPSQIGKFDGLFNSYPNVSMNSPTFLDDHSKKMILNGPAVSDHGVAFYPVPCIMKDLCMPLPCSLVAVDMPVMYSLEQSGIYPSIAHENDAVFSSGDGIVLALQQIPESPPVSEVSEEMMFASDQNFVAPASNVVAEETRCHILDAPVVSRTMLVGSSASSAVECYSSYDNRSETVYVPSKHINFFSSPMQISRKDLEEKESVSFNQNAPVLCSVGQDKLVPCSVVEHIPVCCSVAEDLSVPCSVTGGGLLVPCSIFEDIPVSCSDAGDLPVPCFVFEEILNPYLCTEDIFVPEHVPCIHSVTEDRSVSCSVTSEVHPVATENTTEEIYLSNKVMYSITDTDFAVSDVTEEMLQVPVTSKDLPFLVENAEELPVSSVTDQVAHLVTDEQLQVSVGTDELTVLVATEQLPPVSTDELPVQITSEEVPVQVTTEEVPVQVTSEEVLVPVTTEEVPVQFTSEEVPVQVTSEEVLVPVTTEEIPVEVTTEEVPVQVTSEEAPVRVTTEEVPVQVTSKEVPVQVTSEEVPVQVTTEEVPVQVTSEEVPVQVTTEEVPVQVASEEVPVQVTTEEVPVQVTTEEVPVQVTTEEVPIQVTSEEVPVQVTTEEVGLPVSRINEELSFLVMPGVDELPVSSANEHLEVSITKEELPISIPSDKIPISVSKEQSTVSVANEPISVSVVLGTSHSLCINEELSSVSVSLKEDLRASVSDFEMKDCLPAIQPCNQETNSTESCSTETNSLDEEGCEKEETKSKDLISEFSNTPQDGCSLIVTLKFSTDRNHESVSVKHSSNEASRKHRLRPESSSVILLSSKSSCPVKRSRTTSFDSGIDRPHHPRKGAACQLETTENKNERDQQSSDDGGNRRRHGSSDGTYDPNS